MEIIGAATRVTVYVSESDRYDGKPLYMAILELLKKADCAGAAFRATPCAWSSERPAK